MRKLTICSLAMIMVVCASLLTLRAAHPASAAGGGAEQVPFRQSFSLSKFFPYLSGRQYFGT